MEAMGEFIKHVLFSQSLHLQSHRTSEMSDTRTRSFHTPFLSCDRPNVRNLDFSMKSSVLTIAI